MGPGERTIHTETPRETSDTTENGFEGFSEMMGDIIFEDLDHGNPTPALVRNLCFSAETHDIGILGYRGNHIIQRIGEDFCIRVNLLSAVVLEASVSTINMAS